MEGIAAAQRAAAPRERDANKTPYKQAEGELLLPRLSLLLRSIKRLVTYCKE
jgi:hypothetical protein